MTTLAHLKALLQAATPGPVVAEMFGDYLWRLYFPRLIDKDGWPTAVECRAASQAEIDRLVAAVNALPALIAVAEAAQKFRGQLGDHHHWRCQYNDGPHTGGPWDCTCGSHELRDSLAALDAATGKGTT